MRPPSVEALANTLLETGLPKPLCVDIAREAISSTEPESINPESINKAAFELAKRYQKNMLGVVVNATGVLLHTNLGRAPYEFSQKATYTNLEFDNESGERGSRQNHVGSLFARLAGAEAGLVVNNCSAAVTLILAALAGKGTDEGSVIVSRGELVEIGGGFRVPEVIASSGAQLIEVGSTNRTRLKDYEKAISKASNTAKPVKLCLKVHQSNYTIKGFTESVSFSALADLPVPLIVDLGSGLLDARCPWLNDLGPPSWLAGEPAVKQTLEAGADLVAFSADKLLGGSQAGIILGKDDLIKRCSEHPLARAFRLGGLSIATLVDLAFKYLNCEGQEIPFWKMATTTLEELEIRVDKILSQLNQEPNKNNFSKQACFSLTGGGTLPDARIPSMGIQINGDITAKLRESNPPIIARVQDGNTIIDLRTVFDHQDQLIVEAFK